MKVSLESPWIAAVVALSTMQNLTTTTSNHNTTKADLSHPQAAAATSAYTRTHIQINPSCNVNLAPETAPLLAHSHIELTESDIELLAATETHNESEHNTTMSMEHPNWFEHHQHHQHHHHHHHHHHHQFLPTESPTNNLPLSLTHQEHIEANMPSMEQWLLRAIPQYHTQYPAAPPISNTQEINLITHYLKDIATLSTLTTDAPPNMWLLYATEYISDALLLNVIRNRAENYQPYVWNDKHQALMARKEAKAMSSYLNQYDSMWQELHEHSTDL